MRRHIPAWQGDARFGGALETIIIDVQGIAHIDEIL
jgi:hypothetical protein